MHICYNKIKASCIGNNISQDFHYFQQLYKFRNRSTPFVIFSANLNTLELFPANLIFENRLPCHNTNPTCISKSNSQNPSSLPSTNYIACAACTLQKQPQPLQHHVYSEKFPTGAIIHSPSATHSTCARYISK